MAEQKNLDLNDVWRVIEKFKESVLRLGINLYEHFQRFDPVGEHLINEYFFRKVLEVCLRNEVPLSEDEIVLLINYFQYRDGRIMYTELCDRVHDKSIVLSTDIKDNIMTGLEWEDPLHINALDQEDELKLQIILSTIAAVLIRNDHPIDVHFKEYEQIARNPGCVSINHLARIFRNLSVNLNQNDFNLIVKRYSRHNFLFNYIPFLDELNTAIKCSSGKLVDNRFLLVNEIEKVKRPDILYPKSSDRGKELGLPVSFRLLTSYSNFEEGALLTMRRIKRHVFVNGINIAGIFQDLDKYRTGIVSNSNFRRAITNCGINCGVNSKMNITDEDLNGLIEIYQKPYQKNAFMWRLFVNDVVSGLLKHELTREKYDEQSDLRYMPAQGNIWSITPEEVRFKCEETLGRLKTFLKARRWTLQQFFHEYDPTNAGYVNLMHFRTILSSNRLVTDSSELDALEKRYVDSKGFNYYEFLKELRLDSEMDERPSKTASVKSTNISIEKLVNPCFNREYTDTEIADAIRRIRKQMIVNSIKLDEHFKQFDPLNKFLVTKTEFLRVLASNNINFTNDEGEVITMVFKAPLDDRIDYQKFLDVINEAYTQKYLDKAPLIIPIKHIPVTDEPTRFLNMEERRLVEIALDKLSNKICMINYDDAKCFDHSKAGDLGRSQFLQFLDSFKLKLSDSEIDALMKAFGRKVGGVQYLEYLPLLNTIDILYKQKKE